MTKTSRKPIVTRSSRKTTQSIIKILLIYPKCLFTCLILLVKECLGNFVVFYKAWSGITRSSVAHFLLWGCQASDQNGIFIKTQYVWQCIYWRGVFKNLLLVWCSYWVGHICISKYCFWYCDITMNSDGRSRGKTDDKRDVLNYS